MATPVEINSDQTDYTFLGDTTYFVDANVTLYGATTFKSGTVLKYNGSGQLNIDSGGTVICPTNGYPVIFTSMNDDSVGETISGSSGTPGIYDIYTDSGTDVNTFLNYSGTLSNMRFSYAYSPLDWYTSATFQDCQFFYDAYMYVQTAQIVNNLFVEVNDLDWFPSADNNLMQNNTFVNSGVICDSSRPVTTVVVSDNLFDSGGVDDWTSAGTTGGNNAFYNCEDYLGADSGLPTDFTLDNEPDYQSGPLGSYYLPSDSSLIDAGNTDSGSAGLASFTTQADQTPDSGTVDIGYHYPIWSYVVLYSSQSNYTFLSNTTYFIDANITLSGTTTFQSGTVLKYNGSGQINLPLDGTVVFPAGAYPAIFTSYNDNAVGAVISGSSGVPTTGDVNTFLNVTNVTLFNLRFYYANTPFQYFATVWLDNCQFFYVGNINIVSPTILNNVFVGVDEIDWYPGRDADADSDEMIPDTGNDNLMVNNTFVNCSEVIVDSLWSPTEVWVVNNLFDTSGIVDWSWPGVIGGHNAFSSASDDGLDWGDGLPTDWTLSSEPDYQMGPLGSYYLPSDSELIDVGQWDAYTGALYADPITVDMNTLTTQTNQTGDSGVVDIGYHYLVAP
jgi:hypothetical protein